MTTQGMKLYDIFQLQRDERLNVFYNRVITIPTSARTALKKELLATLGADRTKGVFLRYGRHCGIEDAQLAMSFDWKDSIELIKFGPNFHIMHGYLDDVNILDIKFNEDSTFQKIDLIWKNSFEVSEYLKDGQFSSSPVCHTLCGYASGYLSTVLNIPIIVKEVECRGMGHADCRVVCLPLDSTNPELKAEDLYYQSTSMIAELDEVTAKLTQERDYLKQANDVHKKLFKAILDNRGIQKIVDILFENTNLSTYIENENHHVIVQSKIDSMSHYYEKFKVTTTELLEINPQLRLLKTPIYFEDDIRGYCTFVYEGQQMPTELDYLLLDKASLVASTILLNENIKISTEQNIKRNFLNDILEERLTEDEIHKIAYYLKFPPNQQYWMLSLEKMVPENAIHPELEVYETILRQINLFFKDRNIQAIVSLQADKVIILIEYTSFLALAIKQETLLKKLLSHCNRLFKKSDFVIGVSTVCDSIMELPRLYKETLAALTVKNAEKTLYYYDDLETESILFQIQDEQLINRFINKQVGDLLALDKDFDLTKTFYSYIENGISINNTAKVLSMSISGLRYRLTKISEILNVELDNTKQLFDIYLALKIMKAKGVLKF